MAAVMGAEGNTQRWRRAVAARKGIGAALAALVWALAVSGTAWARVERPVPAGVPGEASELGVWLVVLVALVVSAVVAVAALAAARRRRSPERIDVYALVRRAIEAEPSA
jgi:hypothetical protein